MTYPLDSAALDRAVREWVRYHPTIAGQSARRGWLWPPDHLAILRRYREIVGRVAQ